jgi:hypothetical protein
MSPSLALANSPPRDAISSGIVILFLSCFQKPAWDTLLSLIKGEGRSDTHYLLGLAKMVLTIYFWI